MSDKIVMKARGGSAPICPSCSNCNAMLDQFDFDRRTKEGAPTKYFECRDCGYKIDGSDCDIALMKLDKPGMGNLSTYTEIKRITGDVF